MHKTTVVLTLLFFSLLNGEERLEPAVPDITELPPPYEVFYPEYTYFEAGASSYNDLSVYFSFLDGLSKAKIIALTGLGPRRFVGVDYVRRRMWEGSGTLSASLKLMHSSDSLSGTIVIPKLMYERSVRRGIFSVSPSIVFFPGQIRLNNTTSISYTLFEESFSWGVSSNWQRLDRVTNSHFGAFIERESIRYGLFYSGALFPFLHIRTGGRGPLRFTLLVDAQREPLLAEESLFSSEMTDSSNFVCRSRYFGYAELDYYSLTAKGRIYSDIDGIETYKDMGSLFYEISLSQKGKFSSFGYLLSVNSGKNEYRERSFALLSASYDGKEIKAVSSYKICGEGGAVSHILGGMLSLGDLNKRISIGVRNVFSQRDCEEDLYAPVRTYFINAVFIYSSLFGKRK